MSLSSSYKAASSGGPPPSPGPPLLALVIGGFAVFLGTLGLVRAVVSLIFMAYPEVAALVSGPFFRGARPEQQSPEAGLTLQQTQESLTQVLVFYLPWLSLVEWGRLIVGVLLFFGGAGMLREKSSGRGLLAFALLLAILFSIWEGITHGVVQFALLDVLDKFRQKEGRLDGLWADAWFLFMGSVLAGGVKAIVYYYSQTYLSRRDVAARFPAAP